MHFVFAELSKVMLLRYDDVVKVGEKMKHLGDEYERTERGWIQRPDKDYVKNTLKIVGMEHCNPSNVVGATEKLSPKELAEDQEELDAEKASQFRQVVGKCTFYCRKRVDMQYGLKKLQCDMAKPTKGSFRRMKKFLRYMQGTKCYENKIEVSREEFESGIIKGYSDTEKAKSQETRKTVS